MARVRMAGILACCRPRRKKDTHMNARNLRILLAEGGHGEAAESLRALFPEDQRRLELTIVPTISTLLSTIRATNPEMILLDLALTRPEPLGAVRCVHRAAPEVPLIVFAED